MPLTQLAKTQWQSYFDHFSQRLGTELVEIEVAGLGLGHQVEAEWIPLLGISYDPRSDLVAVVAQGVEHLIRKPVQVHVDRDGEWVNSIEVVDAEGNHHIMTLKQPLSLPAS